MFRKKEEADLTTKGRILSTLGIHWRGLVIIIGPFIGLPFIVPGTPSHADWCAYVMTVMAVYWVTECIPLPITGLMPVAVFPLLNVISTYDVCKAYFNGTIMMFIGSIMLAIAVEQCGLHLRIALRVIDFVGFDHVRLFFAVGVVTMVISMWITNTAATTMMVPIVFAVLRTFERNGYIDMYETSVTGERYAGKVTVAYFCMTTYSATIGGSGTLVGTDTNLVFTGLYMDTFPQSIDSFSFIRFSMFGIPLMICMELATYFCMAMLFFGLGRPWSSAWKKSQIPPLGKIAARKAVQERRAALGNLSYWEFMVLIFFSGGMFGFFSRSPHFFEGWGDRLAAALGIADKKFIGDASCACIVLYFMMFLPSHTTFFKNLKCGIPIKDLPTKGIPTILGWNAMNKVMPWTFALLLGGGFALSTVANKKYSNLNGKIGQALKTIQDLPHPLVLLCCIIFTVFITNFSSNVIICNVLSPIAIELAQVLKINPKWYVIATGLCASFTFLLPVGTPGNLIVQAAASVRTQDMIIAGIMPTLTTIGISWVLMMFYAPIVWPEFHEPGP